MTITSRIRDREKYPPRPGFTLLEASIVLLVISILMGVAITAIQPNEVERLRACGDILAADLRLAQSVALRDGIHISLALTEKGWNIEHAETDIPPVLPMPLVGGYGTGYQIDAASLVGLPIAIKARLVPTDTSTNSVTFTSTGRTECVETTEFWITIGHGDAAKSISMTVAPFTGLITAGDVLDGPPPL